MLSIVPSLLRDEVAPMMGLADELARWPANFNQCYQLRPVCRLGESEVHNTDKEFRVRMDMQYFKPEEVRISSDNQRVVVHAKHAEKQDEHGYVEREVTRVFKLPEDVDSRSVTSTMNDQGILSIKVQKKALKEPKEIKIPINYKED